MDLPGEKLYYKIGEVSRIVQVEPYVIRYWETEFSSIRPIRTKGSHKLYSKNDIEKLLKIKDFLYNKKFTVKGAKKALFTSQVGNKNTELLNKTLEELRAVKTILSKKPDNSNG